MTTDWTDPWWRCRYVLGTAEAHWHGSPQACMITRVWARDARIPNDSVVASMGIAGALMAGIATVGLPAQAKSPGISGSIGFRVSKMI